MNTPNTNKKKAWQDDKSWSSLDQELEEEKRKKQEKERDNPNDHGFKISLWNSNGTGIINIITNWFKKK